MQCESGDCRFSQAFEDNYSRLCFLRRVFILLITALLLMFGQVVLLIFFDGLKSFLVEYFWFAFIGLTVFICVCMILSCSNVARSCLPWNFLLFIFLIESLTLILMIVAAKYGSNVILLTLACQSTILVLLLVLALIFPIDFTKWTVCILMLFLITFVFALAVIIIEMTLDFPRVDIGYSLIAVVALSLTMLLNIQVLINGAIFELYPEDFVLGAILMFADVIIFLMCFLKLVGFDTDG